MTSAARRLPPDDSSEKRAVDDCAARAIVETMVVDDYEPVAAEVVDPEDYERNDVDLLDDEDVDITDTDQDVDEHDVDDATPRPVEPSRARFSYAGVDDVTQERAVLAALHQFGRMTCADVQRFFGFIHESASARLYDLRKKGLAAVDESVRGRSERSNRSVEVYVVTQRGAEEAAKLPPILIRDDAPEPAARVDLGGEAADVAYWRCRACASEVDVAAGGRGPSVCRACGQIGSLYRIPEGYRPEPTRDAPARRPVFPSPFLAPGPPPGTQPFSPRPVQRPKRATTVDPAEVERVPLVRSPSGVPGLDYVTGGGIAEGYVVMVAGPPGCGKCLGLGTPVMMHDGSVRPVEDVRVGDALMGPDSKPRKVLATNVGRGPLYQIQPIKGDPWVCNDAHVMTLAGTKEKMGTTVDVPLHEHIARCEMKDQAIDRDWKLLRASVNFSAAPTETDPYLVGVWIGDGTIGEAQITNREPEIIRYCQEIAALYHLEVVLREVPKANTWNIRFRSYSKRKPGEPRKKRRTRAEMKERNLRRNSLTEFFRTRCEQSGGKTIPREYLINSEAVRLSLLAGLVDTDGYLEPGGVYQITTVSERLRDQYLFLARSLGFAAYASEKTARIKATGFAGTYWNLTISGDIDRIPCRVARRKAKPRRQIKRVLVTGFSATPIGDGDYYGFTIDGDGRFLLGDFTVTHNSTICTQSLSGLAQTGTHFGAGAAYGSAEEDADAVIETADRVALANFKIVMATSCQALIEGLDETDAVVWVVDSLMAITSDDVDGEPGMPSQINACATLLFQRAHAMPGTMFEGMQKRSIYLVAHGTKDGNMAGPLKALHSVDGGVLMEHVDPTGAQAKDGLPWGPVKDQTRPTGYVSARVYRKMRKASNRPVSYFLMQPEFLDEEKTDRNPTGRNPTGGRLDRVRGPEVGSD